MVWTVLVFTWPPLAAFDRRLVAPPLTPGSAVAEIASAFALLTWPGLQYAALAAHRLVGVPPPAPQPWRWPW